MAVQQQRNEHLGCGQINQTQFTLHTLTGLRALFQLLLPATRHVLAPLKKSPMKTAKLSNQRCQRWLRQATYRSQLADNHEGSVTSKLNSCPSLSNHLHTRSMVPFRHALWRWPVVLDPTWNSVSSTKPKFNILPTQSGCYLPSAADTCQVPLQIHIYFKRNGWPWFIRRYTPNQPTQLFIAGSI